MNKIAKYSFIIFHAILIFNILPHYLNAQVQMRMDEYLVKLAGYAEREADAKAGLMECQIEKESVNQQIAQTDTDISKEWEEIYALLGTNENGLNAYLSSLSDHENQFDALASLSPQELFIRRNEIDKLEDITNEYKRNKISLLSVMQDKLATIEGKTAQLRASLPSVVFDIEKPKLIWKDKFAKTKENKVLIKLLYDGSSPLTNLDFILNQQPIDIIIPKKNRNELQTEIHIPIELNSLENKFLARVMDAEYLKSDWLVAEFEYTKGLKGSIDENVNTLSRRAKLPNYKKFYAIIIGISDYLNLPQISKDKGDFLDLKFAHCDAIKFKEFLEQSELSGGEWLIEFFINEKATRKNIDESLTRILLNLSKSEDLIFIFFSGHGRSHPLSEKDVYLLTYDYIPGDPLSGYPYSRLIDQISNARANHIVAFIDACRSGTIGYKSGSAQSSFSHDAFIMQLDMVPENRVIFTSGSGTQPSSEDDNFRHGVFTYFLLKGLNGEAPERKNSSFVDLGELEEYVKKKVVEYTSKHPKMLPQLPSLWEKNGLANENFPVAIRK